MIPARAMLLTIFWGMMVGVASVHAATPLTAERVASGLNRPIYITAAPGDNERLYIIEKAGVIKVLDLDGGNVLATPFLDIDAIVGGGTSNGSEQGLLGLAFHPNYAEDGEFYINYTNTSGDTVVARYLVSANPAVADAGSETIVLMIDQPQANHNGGWIGFGPNDGYLYIATGDGGGADDDDAGHTPGVGNGQDISDNLLGKILRIDVDGASPYVVPGDNPFVDVAGDDEIWAFGLRNPWRPSFDRVTGDFYIADVGQNLWEEVNYQPAGSSGGENYGWRCREGAHDFDTSGDCSQTPFTEPVHEYDHGGSPFRCSVTGGYVYRGCAIPDLRGTYFFGDYCSAQTWSFRYTGAFIATAEDRTAELVPDVGVIDRIVSYGQDHEGELYIVDQGLGTNVGEVFKIVPDGPADPPTPNDYDNNGTIEQFDTVAFYGCIAGPDAAFGNCLCDVFAGDDGDVDLADLVSLQLAIQ